MGNAQSTTTTPREQNRLTKPRTNLSKNPSSTQLSAVTVFGKTISNPQPCPSAALETSHDEPPLAQQLCMDERGAYDGYRDQPQASAYRCSFKRDNVNRGLSQTPKPSDFDPKLYSTGPYGSRTSTMASFHRSKRLSSTFVNSSRLSLAMSTRYPDTERVGGQVDRFEGDVPAESETISSKSKYKIFVMFPFGVNEVQPQTQLYHLILNENFKTI